MSSYTTFKTLGIRIRQGKRPDSPDLIHSYIECGTINAEGLKKSEEREIYLEIFYTLLETLCDTTIADQWRNTCLDNIYLPLAKLKRISQSKKDIRQLRELSHELFTLSHYFLSPSKELRQPKNSSTYQLGFSSQCFR